MTFSSSKVLRNLKKYQIISQEIDIASEEFHGLRIVSNISNFFLHLSYGK